MRKSEDAKKRNSFFYSPFSLFRFFAFRLLGVGYVIRFLVPHRMKGREWKGGAISKNMVNRAMMNKRLGGSQAGGGRDRRESPFPCPVCLLCQKREAS